MSITTVGISMNNGYPGTISRNSANTPIVSRNVLSTDTANINYGDAVVLNEDSLGGTYSQAAGFIALGGTFTMTQGGAGCFAGIAVREVGTMRGSYVNPLPTLGFYPPGNPCDVVESGSVIVAYHQFGANVAPKAGGKVFLRTATNGAGTAVGQFESAADGGNTVQLTNAFFATGVVDANNNVEITLVARNAP